MNKRSWSVLFLLLSSGFLISCKSKKPAEVAADDGILILGNSNEPKGLDPHLVSGVLENNILRSMFEGLAGDHPSKDGVAIPGAAERWEHSADFKQWTFYLQPEARWSDGCPVNAHDFTYAFQRILSPDLGGPYAEMLYYIEGAEDFNKGKIKDFGQVKVWAEDDLTLKLVLNNPMPFLPEITKHFTWFPVPKHIVNKHGAMDDRGNLWSKAENIVSNGPFKMKSHVLTHSIEVERNEYYWDAKQVKLNGIRFLPVSNAYTEARMFKDGLIHKAYGIPSELRAHFYENYPEWVRAEGDYGTRFIRVNVTKPSLNNIHFRKALALSIDRQLYIDTVRQGGGEKAAYSLTPPTEDYQPPKVFYFDPEEAKKSLEKSGFDGKQTLTLMVTDSDTAKRAAEVLQGMWRKHLGLNIRISTFDWATYLQRQHSLDYDLCIAGWLGDFLDPTTFLTMWTKGNGNNNTGWFSEPYEALLDKAANTADPAKRFSILAEAEKLFLEDTAIIPVFWFTKMYLLDPRVKNWNPLLLGNNPYKFIEFSTKPE